MAMLVWLTHPEDGNSNFLRKLDKIFFRIYGVTSGKIFFIVTAVKTSNSEQYRRIEFNYWK
jgi:hypothetical protein